MQHLPQWVLPVTEKYIRADIAPEVRSKLLIPAGPRFTELHGANTSFYRSLPTSKAEACSVREWN